MIAIYDDIRGTVLHLLKGNQMRLLLLVAMEVADAHPGIHFQDNIFGSATCIIPARNGGEEAGLRANYPQLDCRRLGQLSELCPKTQNLRLSSPVFTLDTITHRKSSCYKSAEVTIGLHHADLKSLWAQKNSLRHGVSFFYVTREKLFTGGGVVNRGNR